MKGYDLVIYYIIQIITMKNKNKSLNTYIRKLTTLLIAFVLMFSLSIPIMSSAAVQNYSFDFYLKANCVTGHNNESKRRRSTDNTSNQWRVCLNESEEGKGAIALFALALDETTWGSQRFPVAQGTGWVSFDAYQSASPGNVWIAAKNNNNTDKRYRIQGEWKTQSY